MTVCVHPGDCVEWLRAYDGPLFDSCVTDPPYHLSSIVRRFGGEGAAPAKVPEGGTGAYARASRGFMGKQWDGGDVAFRPETWRAVFDALKPGAHLVAFSGTRTYHRMACAIEDAGFEIRDCLFWCYGSGFPKSHDISKAIDKAAGHWRGKAGAPHENDPRISFGQNYEQTEKGDPVTAAAAAWQGWGTALKPALEPICLARKPIAERSIAANVLAHGTGALNIDACRVGTTKSVPASAKKATPDGVTVSLKGKDGTSGHDPNVGRWPANLLHDGSDDVVAGFPETGLSSGGVNAATPKFANQGGGCGWKSSPVGGPNGFGLGDSGSAARFFYSAKAGPLDRIGSKHATVKPVDLMRWLCRLITPPGGHILEPFAGSGTTGIAAMAESKACTMIEMEANHVADIERKLAFLRGEGAVSFIEHDRRRDEREGDFGPLFSGGKA